MPVNVLFCEGGPKSPDLRVLAKLVSGLGLTLKPSGGKYGLGNRILAECDALPKSTVAGVRDRDFDEKTASQPVASCQDRMIEGGKTRLGWYWERKEIENYLIDPVVVQRALDNRLPRIEDYGVVLSESAHSIIAYTAARSALSLSRRRFSPLPNTWGRQRGKEKYPFPDNLSEQECRSSIYTEIRKYEQERTIQPDEVLHLFEEILPECQPGGIRHTYFLTYFAGKDLLYGMEPALRTIGFSSAMAFREAILVGIERADTVWEWLDEWRQLRQAIIAYPT